MLLSLLGFLRVNCYVTMTLLFHDRWDPVTRVWSPIAPMSTPRSTCGVAVVGGKLLAVGGRGGNECLSSVESYDPHTNRFVIVDVPSDSIHT